MYKPFFGFGVKQDALTSKGAGKKSSFFLTFNNKHNKMGISNLTAKNLKNVFECGNYVALRRNDNSIAFINSKIGLLAYKRSFVSDNFTTKYISYRYCNFSEYLSHKLSCHHQLH